MKRWGTLLVLLALLAWSSPGPRGAGPGSSAAARGPCRPRVTVRSHGARLQETALGCYVADAMRAGAGTEIAVECGGHLVEQSAGGSLTMEDVEAVFAGDLEVAAVEITAGQLFDLLEYAVGNAESMRPNGWIRNRPATGFPRFPVFLEFDVSQLAGRRIRQVRMADGTELRREDGGKITAALPVDMLDGSLGFSMLDGLSYRTVGRQSQLLAAHIRSQGRRWRFRRRGVSPWWDRRREPSMRACAWGRLCPTQFSSFFSSGCPSWSGSGGRRAPDPLICADCPAARQTHKKATGEFLPWPFVIGFRAGRGFRDAERAPRPGCAGHSR